MPKRSEDALIDDVERRLVDEYAQLPAAEISGVIRKSRDDFTHSRVRDFVPLLVERRARRELTRYAQTLSERAGSLAVR